MCLPMLNNQGMHRPLPSPPALLIHSPLLSDCVMRAVCLHHALTAVAHLAAACNLHGVHCSEWAACLAADNMGLMSARQLTRSAHYPHWYLTTLTCTSMKEALLEALFTSL